MTPPGPAQPFKQFAADIGKPYGFERSVKFGAAGLLDERFLMTFPRGNCGARLLPALTRLGRQLEMPESFAAELRRELSDPASRADVVHLGFEGQPDGDVCKVYLEYAGDLIGWLRTAQPGQPDKLAHLGFKWRPHSNVHRAVTRYFCKARMDWPQVRASVAACYDESGAGANQQTHAIAGRLLDAFESSVDASTIMLLQVEEDGNPRHSFDLNLYSAGWRVGEIAPVLHDIAACFGVDDQRLEELERVVGNERLGHIAGGIDRHGKSFFSLYFGREARSI